ncbi:MAG: kelch repeat-containing protein [Acidobacteriota bacterium]
MTVLVGGDVATPFCSYTVGDVWEYDGIWRQAVSGPMVRWPAMAFDTARRTSVVFGGDSTQGSGGACTTMEEPNMSPTWLYDGNSWSGPIAGPPGYLPRSFHATAFDSRRGRLVLFGGLAHDVTNETWEYDGVSWVPGPTGPEARERHAMVYDEVRRVVVLFGGKDNDVNTGPTYFADTWEYDGSTWAPGSPAPAALVPRAGHGMAYDAARARVVLFGGFCDYCWPSAFNDMWELDAAGWVPGPAAPAALTTRYDFGMAYDRARGRTVIFGGSEPAFPCDDCSPLAETWEYDGTRWTPGAAAPLLLTPRATLAMAYDDSRSAIVLYGGDGLDSTTWLLDAAGWREDAEAPLSLGTRFHHAMSYDSVRGHVVLTSLSGTWEYTGASTDYVAGAGAGSPNPNEVRLFTSAGAPAPVNFLAYGATWGTHVATSDLDGGGSDEIITAPGPGPSLGPQVRAFRRDGSAIGKINFFAYGTLRAGANAGAASIDRDAFSELFTGAGPGAAFGPHVRAWNYDGVALAGIAKVSFLAYGTPRFGVNVSGGDVDEDQSAEIVTGPGPGPTFAPQVRAFDYDGVGVTSIGAINFNALGSVSHGAKVAAASADDDNYAELAAATGPGPTLPSQIAGFDYDGAVVAPLPGYTVVPFFTSYGAGLGLADLDADTRAELLAGAGPDPAAGSTILTYAYTGVMLAPFGFVQAFPGQAYGVNPVGGALGY